MQGGDYSNAGCDRRAVRLIMAWNLLAAIGGRCGRIGVVLVVRRRCGGSCLVWTLGLSGAVRVYQACSSRRDMGVRWHIPQAERSKGPILVWLPDPEAISLVTFFFAKRKLPPPA